MHSRERVHSTYANLALNVLVGILVEKELISLIINFFQQSMAFRNDNSNMGNQQHNIYSPQVLK